MNVATDLALSPHMTALRCLFLLARHHGIHVDRERLAAVDKSDTIGSILLLMREIGLSGKLAKNRKTKDLEALRDVFPVMVENDDGTWVILVNVAFGTKEGDFVALLDPRREQAGVEFVPLAQFEAAWTSRMVLCKRQVVEREETPRFGLSWFMPEILRNGRHFRDIAVLAMVSNVIGLGVPLLFNILIDKVIPHHGYNTLVAVIAAFLTATIFDLIFTYVRQYLLLFAGNKIDARLASRTFEQMLRLPMDFFERQTAGVLLRNIQQTEAVRSFLTGRLFFTLLEVTALPVLLICLVLYSGVLTAIVVGFSVAMATVIGIMIPIFRKQLERLYEAEGNRQADLVETIVGMRAVKSLALEPLRQASWDNKVARSVRRRGTVGHFTIVAGTATNGLSSLLTLSLMAVGVMEVFDGNLSLGALVAFNMLSGRVTGPLLQIVSLINEFQQTALSVRMLGTLMDHPPERDPAHQGIKPPITGQLEFKQVSFTYGGAVTPALDRVSFKVEEGQMIGVVGRSGSGKTTLTRLIQGLHTAQEGLIQLNGTDIRHMDLTHLRRSIGVVLQDNILFRGTIRENIAAAKPDAPFEDVMEAARLAGADEFINRLPRSYETLVEESASNFSGGQRQRIAIARALLLRPSVLLFDEATSALDPESEAIIQDNLAEIARGRTMIIVSHRLSSLAAADAILVLDKGKVADFAPHHTLVERCDIYRHLWDQQTRFVK